MAGELAQIAPAQAIYARNKQWALPPDQYGYVTQLDPLAEAAFKGWVAKNNIPFDAGPQSDYDMRGFFKALMSGDPVARSGVNPNDKQLHFTDYFKTPFHHSFSRESKYALPSAPAWNDKDQLIDMNGNVLFDERAK